MKGIVSNNYMEKVKKDVELQKKYDEIVNAPSKEVFLLKKYDPLGEDNLYFVSGQNAYFNKQIEENGLNHIRVEDEDAKVIAMLHSLVLTYGKPEDYGKYDSIIYITPSGTLELGYARQSFPSGILEDVLRWQGDRKKPFPWYHFLDDLETVDLIVGEKEYDYWLRVAHKMINSKKKNNIPLRFEDREISEEQIDNFMSRVRNVFKKFCTGKNRLYFIPLESILNNKITWFAEKIRDGQITNEEYEKELASMSTLQQVIQNSGLDSKSYLKNLKTSDNQWGLALLGEINDPIKYVEIKTTYELLQEYYINHGYSEGEVIDYKEIYNLFDGKVMSTDVR